MKRCSQIALLAALTLIGWVGVTATADEPQATPQPKIVQARTQRIQVDRPRRSFANLLKKGMWTTVQRLVDSPRQYQVRIVSDAQKEQVENLMADHAKNLKDYEGKMAAWEKEWESSSGAGEVKRAELRVARAALKRPRSGLPNDLERLQFYKISDVGSDYVGFAQGGVETFHKLSSIHTIIRGAKIDQQ